MSRGADGIPRTPVIIWVTSAILAIGSIFLLRLSLLTFELAGWHPWLFLGSLALAALACWLLAGAYRTAVRPRSVAAGWMVGFSLVPVLLMGSVLVAWYIRRFVIHGDVEVELFLVSAVPTILACGMARVNHTWSQTLADAERAALAGDGPARQWARESVYRFTILELMGFGIVVAIVLGLSQVSR